MALQKPQLWIALVVGLAVLCVLVGCTTTPAPSSIQESEIPETETLPASDPDQATLEPSPIKTPTESAIPSEETPPGADSEPVQLVNPGFEDHGANGMPAGWNIEGSRDAILIEDR